MRAFVIVPHQDDEINLVGNIFDRIVDEYETYVIYSSIDSDPEKAQIRKQEAYNSCDVFGIDTNHILFLGYPDNSNKKKEHFFSKKDRSIIDRLQDLLVQYRPDMVFGVDFDFHSDHRMLSLAFEEAMGRVLKVIPEYCPTVLKGFCYETSYYGPEDYRASVPGKSLPSFEVLSNGSFEWENRICIDSRENPGVIWKRRSYKALKCHASQYAVLHARSVINSDNVFWQRRSDNRMLAANVSADSGDVSKLNDFMILDTDDIITINPREIDYSKGIWKSDNNKSEISVKWDKPVRLDRLILHGNPGRTQKTSVNIQIKSESLVIVSRMIDIGGFGRNTEVIFDELETDNLTILLIAKEGVNELSEIEAFCGEPSVIELTNSGSVPARKANIFMDLADEIGYNYIVYLMRLRRKIGNILKR